MEVSLSPIPRPTLPRFPLALLARADALVFSFTIAFCSLLAEVTQVMDVLLSPSCLEDFSSSQQLPIGHSVVSSGQLVHSLPTKPDLRLGMAVAVSRGKEKKDIVFHSSTPFRVD